MKVWSLLALTALFSGCLPVSDEEQQKNTVINDDTPVYQQPLPVKAPIATYENETISVTWDLNNSVETTLYITPNHFITTPLTSETPGITAYEHVTPPFELPITKFDGIYHIYQTQTIDNIESLFSEPAIVIPRYVIQEEEQYILDKTTNTIWFRCLVGQTWNAQTNLCDGTPSDVAWSDLNEIAANNGGRVPTEQELLTLVYCDNDLVHDFPLPPTSTLNGVECYGDYSKDVTQIQSIHRDFFGFGVTARNIASNSIYTCLNGTPCRKLVSFNGMGKYSGGGPAYQSNAFSYLLLKK